MNSTKIFVTIDTEWDRKKNKAAPISVHNLSRIRRFQQLCDKYDIKPIYFCTYETLLNKEFVDYLKEYVLNARVEIGSHLHPWSTPPFPYGSPLEEQRNTSFPHDYPHNIFMEKLKKLTEMIENNFKISPLSYRAGRFGFIREHIPMLSKLGYKIDSSITPYISHLNTKGWKKKGIDFSQYIYLNPKTLYFQNSSIIEIPITIIPYETLFISIIKKILRRKKIPRWFRILPKTNLSDLMNIIKKVQNNKIKYLVYMMHSNEFHYKTNVYFDTKEKQQKLFILIEKFFQKINSLNIKSITFNDYMLHLREHI